ncbi:TonB-dependent receptor [Sphingomonas bacterium]|uniref:TonB-dependent receptor n=1 Tax=Sphingomonas bacterium TaxID=1895847 RepID=UPI001575A70A|nr:TonB-dependent receptor [Sphingomonas bacterium]
MYRRILLAGVSILSSAFASAAAAQDAPLAGGPDAGEIIVTAQRRSQSVRDVPIAITAFSGGELQQRAIVNSVDVARVTPGAFVSASGGGQFSQFSIRGVTQNDINDFVEGPVAVYVDDTYVPSPQGQTFGLFDLDRVEVLKGPQGTLFGRNATGGLVHFIVAKPSSTTNGYMNFTYGRYNQTKLEGAIGGPISDTLEYRASLYWNRYDPWMKNIYPGNTSGSEAGTKPIPDCCDDAGNDNTLAGRLQLQYKPSDRLTIRATGSASRDILSTAPYNQIATVPVVSANGGIVGGIYASPTETRSAIGPDGRNYTGIGGSPAARVPGADWFGYLAPSARTLQFGSDYSQRNAERVRSYDVALHIDYDLGGATLTSITNWKKLTKHFGLDGDSSPLNFVDVWSDADTRDVSQEVRVTGVSGPLTWTTGAYFLRIKTRSDLAYVAPANSLFAAIVGFPTTGIDLGNVNHLTDTSGSLFGQAEYRFAPKLTLVVGSRVIREHQHFDVSSGAFPITNNYALDTSVSLFTPLRGYENRRTQTLWTGKVQLEYRPDGDTLLYVGVNRGVKAGNYNSQLPDGSPPLPLSVISYDPETLVAYEGGLKRSFPAIRGYVALSGYYYDYHNYQAFLFSNASGYTQNRNARTYGAEIEASIEPASGLRLTVNGSIVDPKVKNLQITDGVLRNVDPTFTPHRQIGGEVSYTPRADMVGGKLTFNVNGHYNSSFFTNIRNFDSQKLPGYVLFNGSVTWASDTSGISIALMLDNMFDKRYAVTSFDLTTLCGCSEIAYGRPRWWGVRAGYKF